MARIRPPPPPLVEHELQWSLVVEGTTAAFEASRHASTPFYDPSQGSKGCLQARWIGCRRILLSLLLQTTAMVGIASNENETRCVERAGRKDQSFVVEPNRGREISTLHAQPQIEFVAGQGWKLDTKRLQQ